MAENLLKIAVAAVVLIALTAGLWLLANRGPEKPVGSDVMAYMKCGRCGHVEKTTFDVVIEKGALASEVGWQMSCVKCGGPVAARADRGGSTSLPQTRKATTGAAER